jgi:CDP-diacylglycerol--glycerol-3-phosphate 3-phosphatidyltransferase
MWPTEEKSMPLAEERDLTAGSSAGPALADGNRQPLPSALNLPNIITLSRLVLAIFLFCLIDIGNHWLAACIVFVVAAATDAIDGYIARRYGLVTKIGRILDPFVDKVIIGGAFMFLAVQPDSGVNAWMVIAVIGREMFVTSLRSVLESQGKDFSATTSGKIKMAVQCLAVAGSLLFLEYARGAGAKETWAFARDALLWGAVAVTIYSGYEYIIRAMHLFRSS